MNILVIVQNLENSAPGLVDKKIINGLSSLNNVDVLCAGDVDKHSMPNVRHFYHCKFINLPIRLKFFFQKTLRTYPSDIEWSRRAKKAIPLNGNYDIVFAMISMSSYCPIYVAPYFAKHFNAKYAVFSVDAIPAPGWNYNKKIIAAQKKAVAMLKDCDYIASVNKWMLNHQVSTFVNKKRLFKDVINLPTEDKMLKFEKPKKTLLLYAGRVYADRKICYLLDAFEKYLEEDKTAILRFVGANFSEIQKKDMANRFGNHIEIISYTNDLLPHYKDSSILIDIDADIENDVFLSSKIIKYLSINRIILSETGNNSPSRHLFSGYDSIVQCGHNALSIYNGLKIARDRAFNLDFSDRQSLIEQHLSVNINKKINENFIKLYNDEY